MCELEHYLLAASLSSYHHLQIVPYSDRHDQHDDQEDQQLSCALPPQFTVPPVFATSKNLQRLELTFYLFGKQGEPDGMTCVFSLPQQFQGEWLSSMIETLLLFNQAQIF